MELNDFDYHLPTEKIPKHPLSNRSESKLLKFESGKISHHHFYELPDLLPDNCSLIFNDTRVIPARFQFHKESGGLIEIFLLKPVKPSLIVSEVMESKTGCSWECMIGNKKRWKSGGLSMPLDLNGHKLILHAVRREDHENIVSFSWNSSQVSFAEIVETIGKVPLPPYLNREPVPEDKDRYQTVYARLEGAVAAPTAGLHFDENLMEKLAQFGIRSDYLTLHVGAGTFQPIKTPNIQNHQMHSEQIVISRKNIEHLLEHEGPLIPVGTTSVRTLESLYWFGLQLLNNETFELSLSQEQPYKNGFRNLAPRRKALESILEHMVRYDRASLTAETGIYIYPGYKFQMCDGLITNYHQPKSSLLLLIAAFIGDHWKKVYSEALGNNYRFLSYGDSSLLLPERKV